MTKKTKKSVVLTAVMLLGGWSIVQAAPIFEHTFDANAEDWTSDSTLLDHGTGIPGADGGYLVLDFNTGGFNDYVRSPGTSGLLGDWNTMVLADDPTAIGAGIRFDFYADTATGYPATLMPYFTADVDGEGTLHTWMLDMTDQAVSRMAGSPGWYTFLADARFADERDWVSTTGGGPTEWQASFDAVTEVGLYLVHTTGDDLYAIDNIGLLAIPVPEPGTWMLLGSALLSLTMTFRKTIGARARELMSI